jgi:ATP-dependent RNA helicase DOB1
MRDQIRRMQRVLRRLGFVQPSGVMDTKGRVACEVNTADELLVTELVFSGTFIDLTDPETSALLSCLVFQVGVLGEGEEEGEMKSLRFF